MRDKPKWPLPADITDLLHSNEPDEPVRPIPAAVAFDKPSLDALAYDTRALDEKREFDDGNYEHQARRNKYVRDQAARGAVHRGSLCLLWLGLAMFAGLNIVWFLHVACGWKFLPSENVTLIQNVIAAVWVGKLGMLLERYAHKHSIDE